ncbi:MAG: hypothetical protein FJX28_10465 [Alphaproteobacteria bacterium]|nr:hypothetical protein [Alphaproteobacteria bacterium]
MHLAPLARLVLLPAALALAVPSSLWAEEDAIATAMAAADAAYQAGDLKTAAAELANASRAISARQSGLLMAQFPPAPDGWTREDTTEMVEGLELMGGGVGAEATYTDAAGMTVTLSAFADNLMVQSFAPIFADSQALALMGKTVDINGVTFFEQEELNTLALLDDRVLLQAAGEAAQAQALLAQIDLDALAAFDAADR